MSIWLLILALVVLSIIAVVVRVRQPSELEKLSSELGILINEERFEEALPLAEKAVSLAEGELDQWTQNLGSHHTNLIVTGQLASALGTLGQLQFRMEDTDGAEASYQRAISVLESSITQDLLIPEDDRTPPPPHPDLPEALLNLAFFYSETERSAQAASTLRQTIEVEEALDGKDHPVLALPLVNLAEALGHLGEQEEAESALLRAIAVAEPHAASGEAVEFILFAAFNNLGQMFKRQGRVEEAAAALQRALEIAEHNVEEHRPAIERIRNALAELEAP